MHVLTTLAHGIELPALSHRTGTPCRSIQTRELVLKVEDDLVELVGARDRRMEMHRTALRVVRSVQRGLIVCARELRDEESLMVRLHRLPCAVDWNTEGSLFNYYSVGVDDRLDLEAAWADTQGNIIAQMLQVCGLLVPASDSVTAPIRQVGHLWPNGKFAHAANSAILSFVRGRGVVFAANVPTTISDEIAEHFNRGWGGAWEPVPLSEKTMTSAALITAQCGKPKPHIALTPELVTKAMGKQQVDLTGWWSAMRRIRVFHHVWRNGVSRDGTQVGENWPINRLFVSSFPSDRVHAIVS